MLYFRHKRAEQRAPGTTGIQTKTPYDKTHLVYLLADMVIVCGRYGHTLWPIWFVADMVVANMVCDQYGIGQFNSILHSQYVLGLLVTVRRYV